KAETTGEEAVPECILEQVASASPGGHDRSRHDFPPDLHVAGRVADHRRLAFGAGGSVDAHELFARNREQAERIVLAQIALSCERQPWKILQPLHASSAQAF